jgi:hypothetical protein
MHIKEENGEKLLAVCCYKKPGCLDRDIDNVKAKKVAEAFSISKISHGICASCERLISQEMDKEEMLALKDSLIKNH